MGKLLPKIRGMGDNGATKMGSFQRSAGNSSKDQVYERIRETMKIKNEQYTTSCPNIHSKKIVEQFLANSRLGARVEWPGMVAILCPPKNSRIFTLFSFIAQIIVYCRHVQRTSA